MNLIVCLDNRNGMMFNKRRQSRDKVLCERVLALVPGKLYMSEYSAKLFGESAKIIADNDFALHAGAGDYCFCEEPPVTLENVDQIIIYRWNRHYPADRHFGFDLDDLGFELASSEDFIGNSHPVITEQIFKKIR